MNFENNYTLSPGSWKRFMEYKIVMKYLHTYLVWTLLLISAFGCGSTEDPDDDIEVPVDKTMDPSSNIKDEVPVIAIPGEGLRLGTKAPDFELPDSNNENHSLSETLKSKNVVIVFYRGGW